MKLALLLIAVWLVWRWSLASLRRKRRDGPDANPTTDGPDLTRQDISDADYEELP